MATSIPYFPMITEKLLEKIDIRMSEYIFHYTENSIKKNLVCDKINNDSEIYMINDNNGVWDPDEHNFGINRSYKFNKCNNFFGREGIACNDSVIGIAIVWTSSDSKQRGAIEIGEIYNTCKELNFIMKYSFDKAQLRGDVAFTTVLYIKNPGNPLIEEQHLANNCGCILGEIDKFYLRLDGNGSIFPIYEINDSSKPLWYLKCEWEDPRYDDFEECVSIYINKGHKNYKYLDESKRTYNEQLLKEIMASALTIIISKLKDEIFWDGIVSGTIQFEDGSVAQAVRYFITTLGWNITTPELLSYSIREFLDERM